MTQLRQPAVAGMFYPADPRQLREEIDDFLQHAEPDKIPPKAIIAPHAGYVYSGPIAASAYASLRSVADKIKKVVLLGPAHRIPFKGLAAPTSDGFVTPLGVVPVDQTSLARVLSLLDALERERAGGARR